MSALPSRPPRRIVVKLGTGVLTSGVGQLDPARIAALCGQFAALRAQGVELFVVSSGAIALGMGILGLARRPQEMARKQACAAIGQNRLMETWRAGFAPHGLPVAQALLTHEDLRGRDRHLGVKETLRQIVAYGAIPIINENDTVSSAEIKFGENDTLSALVASLVGADYLFILSTAPGLIDLKGTGEIVPWVEKITPKIEAMAGGTTSETAVGGMISKISAAKIAVRAGCGVFIASGAEPDIVPRLLAGTAPGTFFAPAGLPLEAKKRWLAFFQRPTATIKVDPKAASILREKGGSLLAVGVIGVEGRFEAGEVVNIAGPGGIVIGHGTSGYSSSETTLIAGKHSEEIRALFPQRKRLEVIHRDGLVLL
ncbi:MAG TPA: glutamate 5-kinase [Opitutaceae bacterium]|nr:glutamate 5-kinase [Opitutaceae bacterium]